MSDPRWRWEGAKRTLRRYALSIWVVLFTLAVCLALWGLVRVDHDIREVAEDAHEERDRDEARACVSAWTVREDARDMAETTYRRNAETLIIVADASPDVVTIYREQVERDVVEIRETLSDPDCDREAAEAALEKEPA